TARAAEAAHLVGQIDDPVARGVDVEHRRVHRTTDYDRGAADHRRRQPASTSQPKPLERRKSDMRAVIVGSELVRRMIPKIARIAADTNVIARECRLNQLSVRVSLPMAR